MTLKLFVADDSVTIQKIVSLAFSGEDVVIETAADGDSALEKIRRFEPDVVLADIFMPGCSGYEVCSRVKEDHELGHIPVILLVGTFDPFDEAEASRVKSDGWLTKPFDTDELTQAVHSAAQNKRSPQKKQAAAEPDSPAAASTKLDYSNTKGLVTPGAWNSFLGDSRILDLFDPASLASTDPGMAGFPAERQIVARISEDSINEIVERVVRRMSPEVIREVAWEVVPELSESIIRSRLQKE